MPLVINEFKAGESMLVIALIGGNEKDRDKVTDRICQLSADVARFDMRYPKDATTRAKQVKTLIDSNHLSSNKTLIYPTVLTQAEAQQLRAIGAVFVVVKGVAPSTIAIERGDLFVSNTKHESRHYMTAEHLYSEALQRYSRSLAA